MTYDVFGGTLNPAQLNSAAVVYLLILPQLYSTCMSVR